MDEKTVPLSDSLIKVVAWTHNMLVNKLGYCPLQLVTGKAVTLPGLTTVNVTTESSSDAEAVQKSMENLTIITSEFSETDMH